MQNVFMNFVVEVQVSTILDALKKYREEHIVEYAEAKAMFQSSMIEKANATSARINAGDYSFVHGNFGLSIPINCLKNYDEIIETFSSINTPTINLNISELNKITSNSWDWLNSANAINATYSATLRSKLF